MWTHEEKVKTTATADAVWKIWSKPESWTDWDDGLEWVKFDGPLVAGSKGKMKPKGAGPVEFFTLEVSPGRGFSDRTLLPLAKMDFIHRYTPLPEGGGHISHRVEISGPLSFLFGRVIGKNIQKGLPEAMRKLASLAERDG